MEAWVKIASLMLCDIEEIEGKVVWIMTLDNEYSPSQKNKNVCGRECYISQSKTTYIRLFKATLFSICAANSLCSRLNRMG